MLKYTVSRLVWSGGLFYQPSPSEPMNRRFEDQRINATKEVVRNGLPRDFRSTPGIPLNHNALGLSPYVYNEILKLPLRYALHPFDKIVAAQDRDSVTGYVRPLGPADELDVIPFHIHRSKSDNFRFKLISIHLQNLDPRMYLRIMGIEGDMCRFDDELIKILPTKKTYVRDDRVLVYNVGTDVIYILRHWFIGMGF